MEKNLRQEGSLKIDKKRRIATDENHEIGVLNLPFVQLHLTVIFSNRHCPLFKKIIHATGLQTNQTG